MNRCPYRFLTLITLVSNMLSGMLTAEEEFVPETEEQIEVAIPEEVVAQAPAEPFVDFTGRITRNKVRMRLKPTLEAPILRELTRDDLLIVIGEADEFYAVKPPKDTKAYIFRTFVLDNKVEGNKVNVRLEPALEAPVIAQLHSGDSIDGVVSAQNSKWLEISPPSSTRFYVCKEYVEKIGSPKVMAQIEKRREEVNELLNLSYQTSQRELEKSFDTMNVEPVITGYNKIIREYSDFPDHSARAKELLSTLKESLLQKKIAYLEEKTASISIPSNSVASTNSSATESNSQVSENENAQKIADKNAALTSSPASKDEEIDLFAVALPTGSNHRPDWNNLFDATLMGAKMANWIPIEQALYGNWARNQEEPTYQRFYEQQMGDIVTLTGILESYSRSVKNKPGDFLLVSSATNLPIAYLYSTSVNLQDKLGHVTTVHAVKRPNNNFAFPAYFVISME